MDQATLVLDGSTQRSFDFFHEGATLPDIGLRPIPIEQMSCLKPEELGTPEFTIEGWLELIRR